MRKVMYFKLAGKEVHMPKLIGAFILFAAMLMFVKASADMFNSWDSLKTSEECIGNIGADLPEELQMQQFGDCRDDLYYNTGIYLADSQAKPTSRQFWSALLGPIASVLFWIAILFLGWMLYRTGELVLPIEEVEKQLPEESSFVPPSPKKTKKAKKK